LVPSQVRNDQAGGARTDYDDALLIECIDDCGSPGRMSPSSVFFQLGIDPDFAGVLQLR